MTKCLNEEIGHLLPFYEMDALSEDERDRFEEHLLECPFCHSEVSRMYPAFRTMDQSRAEILARLQDRGISFASLRQKLLAPSQRAETTRPASLSIWKKLVLAVQSLRLPGEAIPALISTTLILWLILLPTHPSRLNPYLPWLSFQKAHYQSLFDRAPGAPDARKFFQEGMKFYQKNNFKAAITWLEKAAREDSLDGRPWLFLGICYYLVYQPAPAAAALATAAALSEPAQRNRAHWYLAQAYLLEQDTNRSIPLLQSLVQQGFEYSEEADSLLTRIREISK